MYVGGYFNTTTAIDDIQFKIYTLNEGGLLYDGSILNLNINNIKTYIAGLKFACQTITCGDDKTKTINKSRLLLSFLKISIK